MGFLRAAHSAVEAARTASLCGAEPDSDSGSLPQSIAEHPSLAPISLARQMAVSSIRRGLERQLRLAFGDELPSLLLDALKPDSDRPALDRGFLDFRSPELSRGLISPQCQELAHQAAFEALAPLLGSLGRDLLSAQLTLDPSEGRCRLFFEAARL